MDFSRLKGTFLEPALRRLLALWPYGSRVLDAEFRRHAALFSAAEGWPVERVREFQTARIAALLDLAWREFPGYRELYGRHGVGPGDFRALEDLEKFPAIGRDELRRLSREAERRPTRPVYSRTSGTTGSPLVLRENAAVQSREFAAICHQWARLGFRPGDGRVDARGFLPADRDFQAFPDHRVLRLNVVTLSRANLHRALDAVERTGYRFLLGYPSAVAKLARLLLGAGREYRPRGIMLASEPMRAPFLAAIAEGFPGVPLLAHYGQAEKAALGAWLPRDRRYHLMPAYAHVTFDPGGRPTGTSLVNDVLPVIRCRLTDLGEGVEPGPFERPTLYPVVADFAGRVEDITYDAQGREVPPPVVTFPFKSLRSATAARLTQHGPDRFTLLLEGDPAGPHAGAERPRLLADLRLIYGPSARIAFDYVPEIPRDPSGKFRWLVRECPAPGGAPAKGTPA